MGTTGGGPSAALTHCVIHGLDVVEAVPLARMVPAGAPLRRPGRRRRIAIRPNFFGVDLSGVDTACR